MGQRKGKTKRSKYTHVRAKSGEHFFLTSGEVKRLRKMAKKRFQEWLKDPKSRGFKIRGR